jgi:GNAT superfamily N-acetyltransferase
MVDRRPSPWQSALKLGTRLRARGPGEIIMLAAERLREFASSDDVLVLYVRPTSGRAPSRSVPPELVLRWAMAEDGPRYARDIGTDSARTFRDRLSESTRCFLAERDDLIVHASWVTTAAAWTRELRRYFGPPAGDAYVYESFTRPEVRGQGVYPLALDGIVERLAPEGVARAWVGVEADNPSSARAVTKAGFKPGCEIPFGRRLGRLRVEPPEGPLAGDCRGCLQR